MAAAENTIHIVDGNDSEQKIKVIISEDDVFTGSLELPLDSPASNNSSFGKIRKSSKLDKICLVCGDKALGCNFNAVSCESCKAFFRRNALRDAVQKCLFSGSCNIDSNTRRFCASCRLNKCLAVGMKKDLILCEEKKNKRKSIISSNRERKKKDDNGDEMGDPALPPSPALPIGLTEITLPQAAVSLNSLSQSVLAPASAAAVTSPTPPIVINNSIPLDVANGIELLTKGGLNLPISDLLGQQMNVILSRGVPTVLAAAASPDNATNLLSSKMNMFAPTPDMALDADKHSKRRLTKEELDMLDCLRSVYDISFTADVEPLVHIGTDDATLNQLINQSSITVLRFIKFAKRLAEFAQLPQECQIGILKGTWIHILLIRCVSLYDEKTDVWMTPRGQIPTDILKKATGFDDLYDAHVNFCKSMRSLIGDDIVVIIIVLVTVLFSPDRPHLTRRDLVSNIQDKYLVLLKHYLEAQLGYNVAAVRYCSFMSKLMELKGLADEHERYLSLVNTQEIEPLMLEIMGLK